MSQGGEKMGRNGKDFEDKKTKSQEAMNRVVSEVSQRGKKLINEGLNNARQVIEENAETWKQKAGELSDKSWEEISDDAKVTIRKHPLKSIAVALGVGVLLGFIFKSD
ncbi:hypothetical protein BVX98_01190 [bacterium F11]|nr:hypothetical protein BVX98_01190 [bacterium F11]